MQYSAGRSFAMSHLFVGGTVIILGERFDPITTMKAIETEKATTCFMVPTMYHRILQVPNLDQFNIKSLRALVSSGARVPATTRKRILEKLTPNFYNYFGSIEAGGISMLKPEDMRLKGDSVGQGVFNMEIRIVDESGKEVPPQEIGKIMGRGPAVAQEYYKNIEATEEYFADGWCRMGDLGRVDNQGYLYLEGREKDMIIRGGVNIYPEEIEETLQTHPSIDESAVIGIPEEEFGEEIAVLVTLKPGEKTSEDEIIQFCEKNLAAYKRPTIVEFLSSLPKTSSGKIHKKILKEKYEIGFNKYAPHG
jgi:acyl-CoA synthetase (AMP-forming)/AMP-acid ligase II